MDIDEAAALMGVSRATIRRYIRLGMLPAKRSKEGKGRPFLIERADVEQLMEHGIRASVFTCITPGCEKRAVHESGRCSRHEHEVLNASRDAKPAVPFCKFFDEKDGARCRRKAQVHGLCAGHYTHARYNVRYEHLIPEASRAPRCLMPECENPQYSSGLCRSHIAKVAQGGHGDIDRMLRREIDIQPLATAAHEQFRLWRTLRGQTLEEIAGKLGVTRERVRQIENKLYSRIRHSVKETRQKGSLASSEMRYLQAIEYPVHRLVFDEKPPISTAAAKLESIQAERLGYAIIKMIREGELDV